MTADVWNFMVALGLAAYLLWGITLGRRLREPGVMLVVFMVPVWTLLGAFTIISAKRSDPQARSTYLEDVMFPVELDEQYALSLVIYFVFAFLVLALLTLTKRADPSASDRNRKRIAQLCLNFPTGLAGLMVAAGVGAQLLLIRGTTSQLGLQSLYNAGRNEEVSPLLLRLLTYINITTLSMLSVSIAAAFVAASYRSGKSRFLVPLLVYLPLVAMQYRINLILGDRGTMLIAALTVIIGTARFGRPREGSVSRVTSRLVMWAIAAVAVYFVAVIGILRRTSTAAGGIRGGILEAASQPLTVIQEFFGGAELAAAHMSLYGLLRYYEPSGFVIPFIDNTYQAYSSALMFPETQGFTIHLVSSWFVIGSVAAPLLAAFYLCGLVWFLVWLGRRDVTPWTAAVVFAASSWAMSVLPVAVLRSGPEGLRGTLTAALLLPTVSTIVLWWGAYRKVRRRESAAEWKHTSDRRPVSALASQ